MNKEDKSILIAMALGDGNISYSKSGNKYHSSLIVAHSLKQYDYILYKRNLIAEIIKGKIPTLHHYNNNGYPGVRFSKGHKYFRILRKWIYKGGKKTFTPYILNKLTPKAIAIWYMDDGNLSAKKRDGKIHAYELFLNTHLSKSENQVIIDYFLDKWDIKFHQVKNKGSYRLRMSTREIRRFLPIIAPYVIPSMYYKVTMIPPSKRGYYKNSSTNVS